MPSLTHVKPVRAGTIFSFMVGENGLVRQALPKFKKPAEKLKKTQG
jgi:hypothetical protein